MNWALLLALLTSPPSAPAFSQEPQEPFGALAGQALQEPETRRQVELLRDATKAWKEEDGPENLGRVYSLLAEDLLQLNEVDAALEAAGQAARLMRQEDIPRITQARAYIQKHAYHKAVSELSPVARGSPKSAAAHGNLCAALTLWGLPFLAAPHCEKAVLLDPSVPAQYLNRAYLYIELGLHARALRDLDAAEALARKSAPGLVLYLREARAYASLRKGELRSALAQYAQVLKQAPRLAWAYWGRGLVEDGLGDGEAARRDLDQALALDPDFAEAYDARASLTYRAGNYAAALQDLDKAVAVCPLPSALYRRALCLAALGRNPEALRDLDDLIKRWPLHREGLLARAQLLERSGHAGKALQDYRAACKAGDKTSCARR